MDEVWERAVETALDGETNSASARTLNLDGAVKCFHGRLPPPSLLEKFQNLEQISIANIGLSSLEKFPRLPNLQKLILSDNRISGGLEFLVEAGLDSLRDLDLSNNRIQYIEDLAPLAQLRLVSLDLYECPVTRVKDYRSRVFGLIRSLKYLDKMDADEIEEEEDEEEEDEDEDEDDDPGSGEVDGEERGMKMMNGNWVVDGGEGGVLVVDEDEESDADEEETETARVVANGFNQASHNLSNGFQVAASLDGDDDDEDVEDVDDDDVDDEIDEEDGEEEDVVEVHEIDDSDDDEGVEEEDDSDDDEDDEEEEVDDEEEDLPVSTEWLLNTEGEIDGHDHGEEDENGEIGEEEEQGVEENGEFEEEDGEDEDEDGGAEFLVQPIGQMIEEEGGGSDLDVGNEEDDADEEEEEEVEDEEDLDEIEVFPSSSQPKRKREDDGDDNDDIVVAKSPKKNQ